MTHDTAHIGAAIVTSRRQPDPSHPAVKVAVDFPGQAPAERGLKAARPLTMAYEQDGEEQTGNPEPSVSPPHRNR